MAPFTQSVVPSESRWPLLPPPFVTRRAGAHFSKWVFNSPLFLKIASSSPPFLPPLLLLPSSSPSSKFLLRNPTFLLPLCFASAQMKSEGFRPRAQFPQIKPQETVLRSEVSFLLSLSLSLS